MMFVCWVNFEGRSRARVCIRNNGALKLQKLTCEFGDAYLMIGILYLIDLRYTGIKIDFAISRYLN